MVVRRFIVLFQRWAHRWGWASEGYADHIGRVLSLASLTAWPEEVLERSSGTEETGG